ncbi:MAG: endonuclease/exonuclease/phosphatase [Bacteroidetes bacterium]|nr:MAG: endonuclease/exonuclease/phosphatase [Bacteroidota bacterium]
MKNLFKYVILSLAFLIVAMLTFYFWASSTNHPEEDYSKLITNDYPENIDTDSVHSLITYNIGYLSGMTNNRAVEKSEKLFDDNLTRVYSQFEKYNADIICFQEIDYHSKRSYYVNQQDELQELGYNYIFQAVNWDVNYLPFPYYPLSAHHGEIYSGQSIFSKYSLVNPERIILERVASNPFYRDAFYLDRLAQVVKTTINNKTIVLINLHLEAFDKATRTKQVRYIAEIYNRYKDLFPVLMAGDFNSDIEFDKAAIKTILEIPGIASAHFNEDNKEKTFPSVNPQVRLDYIFYNTMFIEPLNSEILTSFGESSDHLPVLFEFKLK